MLSAFGKQIGLFNQEVIDPYWDRNTYLGRYEGTVTEDLTSSTTPSVTGSVVRSSTQSKNGGWSMYKPQGASYLNVTATGSTVNLMRTGQFTIETWIYLTTTIDLVTRNYGIWVSGMSRDSASWGFGLEFNNTRAAGSKWAVFGYDGVTLTQHVKQFDANAWVHLCWGRGTGDKMWLGVNGELYNYGTSTRDMSFSGGAYGSPAGGSKIGTTAYLENNYTAYFDNFRITKGVWRFEGGNFPVPVKAPPTPLLV